MMEKWDYKASIAIGLVQANATMKVMGDDGWELVAVTGNPSGGTDVHYTLFFKRQK